jgi:photosystem II stability/assembly factor-like uncharacterized protein
MALPAAAAVVVALLLMGGGVLVGLDRQRSAVSPVTQPTDKAFPHPSPPWPTVDPEGPLGPLKATEVHMFGDGSGWALMGIRNASEMRYGVAHTTDGIHWVDVTPASIRYPLEDGRTAFLLDRDHAWIALGSTSSPPPAQTPIYRTSDGGRSWAMATLGERDVSFMTFPDRAHGWVMTDAGATIGKQAININRTVDGGASWQRMYTLPPGADGLPLREDPAGIGFGGGKVGFTFVDANTGWLVLNYGLGLLVSHDAGRTWTPSGPSGINSSIDLEPLQFFSSQDGLVVAHTKPPPQPAPGESLSVYRTRDGGRSWQKGLAVDGASGHVSFITANEGWAASAVFPKILHHTTDGGASWQAIQTSEPSPGTGTWKGAVGIYFVDRLVGYAFSPPLTRPYERAPGGTLFRTADGGATWTRVAFPENFLPKP